MNINFNKESKIKLPLSDWGLIISYTILIPLFIGLLILTFGIFTKNDIIFGMLVLIFSFCFLIGTGIIFWSSFHKLKDFVFEVSYYHFQPSINDFIIQLIKQVYTTLILSFLFNFIFSDILTNFLPLWNYFLISLALSLILQLIIIVYMMFRKIELISTARESVKTDIIDHILENFPNSNLINEFRFADINIASLFLSAGVTSFGWRRSICLISRYFNWKLTDEELVAVISHEEGHIANRHLFNAQLTLALGVILRYIRYFVIFWGVLIFMKHQFILSTDFFSSLLFLGCILVIFTVSSFLSLYISYRTFLAEINADLYGTNLVGNEIMAKTLRKLPAIIPSPIGYDQSSFLGFRIALIKNRAKNLGETWV